MDKNRAIDRINKLLALANNHAAAPGEKENALEAASKLASKFGLKIVKGNSASSTPSKNQFFDYEFYVKCFDKKFLDLLFRLLGADKWQFIGGNQVYVRFTNIEFNQEAFAKFYKKFVSVYYKNLKEAKARNFMWSRSDTKRYCEDFLFNFKFGFYNADKTFVIYDYTLGKMFNDYSKRYIIKEVV